jgi:Fe2+ transport system protein FeoA
MLWFRSRTLLKSSLNWDTFYSPIIDRPKKSLGFPQVMLSPTSVSFPLEYLPCEAEGCIVDISGEDSNVHRLEEMGVRCGCRVRMVCPGESCLISVDGKRVCLRLKEVAQIFVSRVA